MPNDYFYYGKSLLQKGCLLGIPNHVREMFGINEGDTLEIYAEGDAIVIKPAQGFLRVIGNGRLNKG